MRWPAADLSHAETSRLGKLQQTRTARPVLRVSGMEDLVLKARIMNKTLHTSIRNDVQHSFKKACQNASDKIMQQLIRFL